VPQFNGWKIFFNFIGAKEIMADNNKWWRKGSKEEDEVIANAAEELIKGVTDADLVNKVKGEANINLRDQVTVGELEDWAKDRDLRRMRNRN
jgi:hypothetical protein